ncbi:helix-turn-helix protein [Ureibacillus xyleni]|uniref:Helix-turn-helix protein n=1 Tax=Ureibacillus xyleni TaxID=614648 RepID=A0A285TIH1_9BACL|nr:helix-turn-helix transcriptional regulator [Ureibacillus xyleni]SOC22069.1 helix-turn-helix protein [Ureibacillus xyleni]
MITMQEAIRQRITDLMSEQNLTISQLAEKANVTQSTVNEIVKGRVKNPSVLSIYKLSSALGLELGEFYDHPLFKEIIKEPTKKTK